MRLKYYREEEARHPALHAAGCTFEDAVEVIHRFAKEHEVPIEEVRRTSGCRTSNATLRRIVLNTDRLNWLLVIHEYAHSWDSKARPTSARWHDSHHAELVDILARLLVQRGWISTVAAERAARDLARREKVQARAARALDPEVVRARRIGERRKQIDRLEARARHLVAQQKALHTRLKRARRSLAALERAASLKAPGGTP